MAASSSSSSSFASSSLGHPPTYGRSYVSPLDSTWTPNSATSGTSAVSQGSTPQSSLQPLDLGPPGYEAVIILWEGTQNERAVYLGPWEVIGSHHPRVLWRCSYENERLEHFLPLGEIFPHTLHARHRRFTDPAEMERFLTFREPHRVRYTDEHGTVVHDQLAEVRYEFTSIDSSVRFQGDIRGKSLLDYYDVDVIWSDAHPRTDGFGSVRGLGLVQRLKLWRDNYSSLHSLTVFANRSTRRYQEYDVQWFEGELRGRDDRHHQVRLVVRGRRGSAPDSLRRFSLRGMRPRVRSVGHGSQANDDHAIAPSPAIDIRYLGVQFSNRRDYRRFLDSWVVIHSSDSEFHGVPFPEHRAELESPHIPARAVELDAGLPPVPEPEEDSDSTT